MVIDVIDVELFDLKLSDLIFWPVKKKFAVDIKLPKESLFVGFFYQQIFFLIVEQGYKCIRSNELINKVFLFFFVMETIATKLAHVICFPL